MNQRISRRRLTFGAIAAPFAIAAAKAFASSIDVGTVVRTFADLARREYQDPQKGEQLAALIESNLAAGVYGDDPTPASLAERLMRDAAELTNDKHFYVMTGMGHGMAPSIRPGARKIRPDPHWLEQMRADAFGIGRADVTEQVVGLIEVRRFYGPYAETRAAFGAAMQKVSRAKALVFDLTGNIGGDPASVALLSSHLFERAPFVINRFHWRSSGTEDFKTTRDLAGPIFPENRRVFIAVSSDTFSAGEEFAYNLQALGRATIVGERTGGGAHHAEAFPIGPEIVAFIPCARAENPVTGGNWEGVGVEPNIQIERSKAVAAALEMARVG